ncbi:YjfB family protein [Virgibacillus sp. W0430]|uniref:YjfB family protein n=1 Tax=Virgibacillus sp. W0430 TaxID=3391580 RepID=UPI003F482C79
MDIAAMSILMANQNVRINAQTAVLTHAKQHAQQQGNQIVEMLQQSAPKVEHPSLGKTVDFYG